MADVSPATQSTSTPLVQSTTQGGSHTEQSTVAVVKNKAVLESLNLANVIPSSAITVVVSETDDERSQRLSEAAKDASEKRLQGRVVMSMSVSISFALFVLMAYLTVKGNADQQKLGLDGLKVIIGALGGFLAGRKM